MKRPSRRVAAIAVALVVVAGFVAVRALRTTTTEISESDAVDRYEQATESEVDDAEASDETATSDSAEASDETAATDSAEASDEPAGVDADADQVDPDAEETGPGTETTTTASDDLAPVALRLPRPGVYPVMVTGGEQLELATGADRTYPAEGFVTVTPVECGVDVRTDFVVERWQSIELCETATGLELGTERIFHSFFGLDDLLERSCTGSSFSVAATSWLCENSSSVAERTVTAEAATKDVAGEAREVVVFTTVLARGDHPDNVELIELWVDVETGVPARETRTYDFVLDTPLGDAGYTEEYVWEVTSLEPIG